ncbi:MAG: hypothetical protein HQ536_01915 [Parcubacteria group bacterium]|nr:hypothetical protein [Parcubacteria group bacterium]
MSFIKKSNLLPWKKENIDNLPRYGIYTLRKDTTISGILYVGKAEPEKMKEKLLDHLESKDVSPVNYFDWYETRTDEDATALKEVWEKKYPLS